MKGRGNFACRQKIYDANNQCDILTGLGEVADFQIIQNWEKTSEYGDRAEITTLPENSTVWAKIDARRELCGGQKCPQFERCFITKMHQRAAESDILIVNHHLFFADLAIKDEDFAGILPEYWAVVFDEAHELEDVAGSYFGIRVSSYQFQELRRDVAVISRMKNFGSEELDRVLMRLEEHLGQLLRCSFEQRRKAASAFANRERLRRRALSGSPGSPGTHRGESATDPRFPGRD